MSFFTDPTISTLTSGTPSQNVDLAGISFPRRLGFRMASKFFKDYHLLGAQAIWQAYSKPTFAGKDSLGPMFHHEALLDRTRWAKMYFKGIFPQNRVYLKCTLQDTKTGMHIVSFFFEFDKSYQTSLSGRTYIKDPILDKRIIKDGVLYELRPYKDPRTKKIFFKRASKMFKQRQLVDISSSDMRAAVVKKPVIIQTMVRYSEKPKMIFMVTPPHLMSYAKIILILLKQLVDLNFDQSYMTKSNQKPLYKTRFMLDELGNLQSDKHGIDGFQTMLSIGLGQEQQFTLILQTLQQLRDVYGDSVDKIVQGNTSNIVFLKSTDDSMLETLQKMSGKTHKSRINSKTVTRNAAKLIMNNESKVSYTMSTSEEPVISYNDMAFIGNRNSIVFRAGDSPIWNRNQTVLPMSYKLLGNTITQPGHEYTFSTIPTLSSAKDFDVRTNQPNFEEMLKKRIKQALQADHIKEVYKKVYHYSDYQIQTLDRDVYADEIMEMINVAVDGHMSATQDPNSSAYQQEQEQDVQNLMNTAQANKEQMKATGDAYAQKQQRDIKLFAHGMISRNDLVENSGTVHTDFNNTLVAIYRDSLGDFKKDKVHFMVTEDGSLKSADGMKDYILAQAKSEEAKELSAIKEAGNKKGSKTYVDGDMDDSTIPRTYVVQDDFIRFLAKQTSWDDLANGVIERGLAQSFS